LSILQARVSPSRGRRYNYPGGKIGNIRAQINDRHVDTACGRHADGIFELRKKGKKAKRVLTRIHVESTFSARYGDVLVADKLREMNNKVEFKGLISVLGRTNCRAPFKSAFKFFRAIRRIGSDASRSGKLRSQSQTIDR